MQQHEQNYLTDDPALNRDLTLTSPQDFQSLMVHALGSNFVKSIHDMYSPEIHLWCDTSAEKDIASIAAGHDMCVAA